MTMMKGDDTKKGRNPIRYLPWSFIDHERGIPCFGSKMTDLSLCSNRTIQFIHHYRIYPHILTISFPHISFVNYSKRLQP